MALELFYDKSTCRHSIIACMHSGLVLGVSNFPLIQITQSTEASKCLTNLSVMKCSLPFQAINKIIIYGNKSESDTFPTSNVVLYAALIDIHQQFHIITLGCTTELNNPINTYITPFSSVSAPAQSPCLDAHSPCLDATLIQDSRHHHMLFVLLQNQYFYILDSVSGCTLASYQFMTPMSSFLCCTVRDELTLNHASNYCLSVLHNNDNNYNDSTKEVSQSTYSTFGIVATDSGIRMMHLSSQQQEQRAALSTVGNGSASGISKRTITFAPSPRAGDGDANRSADVVIHELEEGMFQVLESVCAGICGAETLSNLSHDPAAYTIGILLRSSVLPTELEAILDSLVTMESCDRVIAVFRTALGVRNPPQGFLQRLVDCAQVF